MCFFFVDVVFNFLLFKFSDENNNHDTKPNQQERLYITKHKNTEEHQLKSTWQITHTNTARSAKQDQETNPKKAEHTQRHTTKSKTIEQHQEQGPRSSTKDKHEYRTRTIIKKKLQIQQL